MRDTLKHDLIHADFLQKPGPGRRIQEYQNRDVIYSQESSANAVFFLRSGMVKLTVGSKGRAKKAVLSILQAGDLFGECCLAKSAQRMSTATSIGESTVIRLEKAIFRRQIERDREFAGMFIRYLVLESARIKADLADHFLNFSERRLARILLIQSYHAEKSKNGPPVLRLSQSALAEMVGTTRARVSSFMSEFKKKGYVRYNGGLEVDAERLTAFLQG